jgi:hypothetical protein
MSKLLDEFKAITRALDAAGIEYAVCGGWAMAIHGFFRATIDIDLLILANDLDRVMQVVREHGYDIDGVPLHFDVEIRRISKIDRETKSIITLDFLLVGDNVQDVWSGRELIKWSEGVTPVVSKDGLIKLKRLAGRGQDLVDIERLEEVHGER